MFDIEDVEIIEGAADTQEEYFDSIQRAINAGMWSMQGSYGRAMMDAICAGRCMLGTEVAHDYWGSRIPARYEVKEGTKGSYDFVVQHMGADWAQQMINA